MSATVSALPHPPRPIATRRIAIVIFGLGSGGAERVVRNLSAYWTHDGHDVSVITVASPEVDFHDLDPEVHRVALDLAGDSAHVVEAVMHSLQRIGALRRALLAARPDVVISFMPPTNVLTLLAMTGTGVPVVVCERTDPREAPIERSWAMLRRLLYPRASLVSVQTESVASWARAFCPRVRVIPNFVDAPPRLATGLGAAGPKRLVALGRLIPAKGFDLLVEAFARVAPARDDWSLTIIGEGPERPALEARVRDLGLASRVALPGRVTEPRSHLAEAHAFVLSSRYEGFPNALLEAMSCGLPVVSFDCPSGPREAIVPGHDGLLVAPGDVAGLASALGRIMDDAALRSTLGRNAARIVDRLGPEAVLPLWSAALDAAMERR